MRKSFWIILLAIVFNSCESDPEYFTISGEIKNANGEKLYLMELQSNNIVYLDSIPLNAEGVFSFKGQTDIPKFYALRLQPNNYLTLIVNPFDQIVVKTDGNNLAENSIIEGSPESKKISDLRARLDETVQKLDSIGSYFSSLIGTREMNKVKDSLAQLSRDIITEHIDYTKNFILENPTSLVSLIALYQQIAPRKYVLNPVDDYDYFSFVDSSLLDIYPESDAVKSLHTQMVEINRQRNHSSEINHTVGIGSLTPEIILPVPEGDTISLSSLKGKYVLIDFWASWCRPCRMENPNLLKNYKRYHEKGFEIFQVSLDKKKDAWIGAIESDQLNWIHVSDLQFWNSPVAKMYFVQAIPANFLIDKKGIIIAKNLRGDALEAKLSEIFD